MSLYKSRVAAAAMLAVVLTGLSACGGGGSSGDTSTSQPLSTTYPGVKPTVGDYFIFTTTTTVTAPAGTAPSTTTSVRTYPVVNADGSLTRVVTGTSSRQARDYAADGKVVALTSSTSQCSYSPGFVITPPIGSAVGLAYSGTTGETCTNTGSTTSYSLTLTTSGTADAIESVTTAAGTFRAFKYTATYVTTASGYVSTTIETCWTDMALGRAVKCSNSYSTVLTGQTTPSSAGTSVSELTAYSVAGAAPVGSTLPRFAGNWYVSFLGSATGHCSSALVTAAGAVSSACVRTNSSGSVIGNFTVSGTVDVSGNVSATGSDGSTFTGSLVSPTTGSGAWVNGSMSGTWSATHL